LLIGALLFAFPRGGPTEEPHEKRGWVSATLGLITLGFVVLGLLTNRDDGAVLDPIDRALRVIGILATIALPGIFPAQHLHGSELMDGGVLNPVPVSVARFLAPGLPVVAVVLNNPLDKPVPTYSIPVPAILPRSIVERISRMNFAQAFDIFMRAVDLSSRSVAYHRLQVDAPEVIVRPEVHHIELLDKVDVHVVAQLGEDALEKVLPELARATSWLKRASRKIFGAGG